MESQSTKNTYERNAGRDGLYLRTVAPESLAEELGMEPGDQILSIDGAPVSDELDWIYLADESMEEIEIRKPDGEIWIIEPELEEGETLGIAFEASLASKTCKNNCIFCFIDQMPKGMRESLYVKDDDERLSFLYGNYITLTNLKESQFERILRWKIPVNISIHTTNPELRVRMLKNRFAGKIYGELKRLRDGDVPMNGQIVLVPGFNDGEELSRTLEDLMALYPQLSSVSVVPVGLSAHREGLEALRPFTKEEAEETLERIAQVQKRMQNHFGTRFVFASDEFYLLAGRDIPDALFYESFPQIENGVGMLADFSEQITKAIDSLDGTIGKRFLIGTGELAYPLILESASRLHTKFGGEKPRTIAFKNELFGENITVSGLFCGRDIASQLREALADAPADVILLPDSLIRNGTRLFLDDLSVEELEEDLGLPVRIIPAQGEDFARALLDSDVIR